MPLAPAHAAVSSWRYAAFVCWRPAFFCPLFFSFVGAPASAVLLVFLRVSAASFPFFFILFFSFTAFLPSASLKPLAFCFFRFVFLFRPVCFGPV
ncbi:hypothetical protein [Pandoravirus japonicus]|uniref:Transmembrane protein n=1 Tax=Pandoravirus japonicus TaxID=2823154 RepID=A0A811BNB3_9VIRU|nr:hypothetical protein [Pandoravirus japonicus]